MKDMLPHPAATVVQSHQIVHSSNAVKLLTWPTKPATLQSYSQPSVIAIVYKA